MLGLSALEGHEDKSGTYAPRTNLVVLQLQEALGSNMNTHSQSPPNSASAATGTWLVGTNLNQSVALTKSAGWG